MEHPDDKSTRWEVYIKPKKGKRVEVSVGYHGAIASRVGALLFARSTREAQLVAPRLPGVAHSFFSSPRGGLHRSRRRTSISIVCL